MHNRFPTFSVMSSNRHQLLGISLLYLLGLEDRLSSFTSYVSFSTTSHTSESETIVNDQVQEIQLTTSLDQEGIKRALQRVLERVP